ncbi:MAG: Crp/Fnr family transcriptional regulator [Candidatus Levyibacteriota bacterium]
MNSRLSQFFLKYPARSFKKGQMILNMDVLDHPYLYFIEKGYVRVYTLLPNGTQKTYIFYRPREVFPIIWTFNHINKHLFYEAMDTVTLRKVPRSEFMTYITNNPDMLFEVIHRIVDIHNIYVDRVDTLEYTNSYTRLISRLLSLANRFGQPDGNKVTIQIPVTHTDIANTIALTRETVSRDMEKLEKKGLVGKLNHFIVLKNVEKLREELEK